MVSLDFCPPLKSPLHLLSLVGRSLLISCNPICRFLILFLSYQNPFQIGFTCSYTPVFQCFPLEVLKFGVIR